MERVITTKGELPGAFEQLILLALIHLGDDAYGMTVRRAIEDRTNRPVTLGAVYATLDRLERKGYVSSHTGTSAAAREGRARRFFQIQAPGRQALAQALDVVDRMRAAAPLGAHATPRRIES